MGVKAGEQADFSAPPTRERMQGVTRELAACLSRGTMFGVE